MKFRYSLIAFLTVMVYSNIFTIPFLYSENFLISQDLIQDLGLFFDKLAGQEWKALLSRPLSTLSFALNFAWGGKNPASYHLVNLIIHLINVFGVYAIAQRFFKFPLISASLFALHPIGTSCVSQIFGRSYSLGTCFMLGALYVYLAAKERKDLTLKTAALLTGLFVLMLLSKQSFVFFPFILIWHRMQSPIKFDIKIPLLLAGIGAVTLFYIQFYAAPFSARAAVDSQTFALSQLGNIYKLVTFYFSPFQTALRHELPFYTHFFSPYVLLGFSYLLGYLTLAIYFRKSPLGFLMGALLLSLLPTNSIFPKDEVILEWRLYPSLVFFCLLMGQLCEASQHYWKPIAKPACLLYLVYLMSFAWTIRETNQHYQSNVSAWEEVRSRYPYSANPLNNLGVIYSSKHEYLRAQEYFRMASEMNPRSSVYKMNLAKTELSLGHTRLSEKLFEEGLALQSQYGQQVVSVYMRH